MSELVANLRSYAIKYANDYGYCVASDLNKAADHIEQMEAALLLIAEDGRGPLSSIARAALAPEQDK